MTFFVYVYCILILAMPFFQNVLVITVPETEVFRDLKIIIMSSLSDHEKTWDGKKTWAAFGDYNLSVIKKK